MLVLAVNEKGTVIIKNEATGEEIFVSVLNGGGKVKIGITAPPDFIILREKLVPEYREKTYLQQRKQSSI